MPVTDFQESFGSIFVKTRRFPVKGDFKNTLSRITLARICTMFRTLNLRPITTNGFRSTCTRKFHFDLLNLRVGFTRQVSLHPDSQKLYVSQIEVGPNTVRQVCSGLREHMPSEALENKLVVVVDNLKKCKLRGQVSEAMILCGEDSAGAIQLCKPQLNDHKLIGRQIVLKGQETEPTSKKLKLKVWEEISPRLTVGENNNVIYNGEDGVERQLCVGEVPIVVDHLPKGSSIR